MIETALQTYLASITSNDVTWGNIAPATDYTTGAITVNFFKLPSSTVPSMPTFLDNFQISVRARYVNKAQAVCNDIINSLHGYNGTMGLYTVHVVNASCLGQLQENINIVHIPVAVGLKYTGL